MLHSSRSGVTLLYTTVESDSEDTKHWGLSVHVTCTRAHRTVTCVKRARPPTIVEAVGLHW